MTAEGVHVPKTPVLAGCREGFVDLSLHSGRGERIVGAGYAFRHGYYVRGDPVVLVAEAPTGPPEAADDLVDDQQHAMPLTDLFYGGQVVFGGY